MRTERNVFQNVLKICCKPACRQTGFTSGFGWIIVGVLALIGLIIGWKSGGFLVGVLGGAVFGIIVGVPFPACPCLPLSADRQGQGEADRIAANQMVSVFMDQKDLLEEILGAIKKS